MNVTVGFGLDRIGEFIGTTALEKDIYGFHSYNASYNAYN